MSERVEAFEDESKWWIYKNMQEEWEITGPTGPDGQYHEEKFDSYAAAITAYNTGGAR
jgi:hypothetical protein